MQVKKVPEAKTITGPLEWDPELRYTPTGTAVMTFQINSLRCEAWQGLAEEMATDERMRNGAVYTVTGAKKERVWKDREDVEHTMPILTVQSYAYEAPF